MVTLAIGMSMATILIGTPERFWAAEGKDSTSGALPKNFAVSQSTGHPIESERKES